MTSRDFVYWLQGYLEISKVADRQFNGLDSRQVDSIQNHLNLVFKHELDPSFGEDHHKLDDIHHGTSDIKVRC